MIRRWEPVVTLAALCGSIWLGGAEQYAAGIALAAFAGAHAFFMLLRSPPIQHRADAKPRLFTVPIETDDEPIILPFVMRRRSPDLHAEGYPRLYAPEGADECGEGLSDGAGI